MPRPRVTAIERDLVTDRGQPPRVDEAPDDGERAPLFGRWGPWYLLVALGLAGMIALCAWITRVHR